MSDNLTICGAIELPILRLERNGEVIDVSEYGITSKSLGSNSVEGDLLFFAYKELKLLRDAMADLLKRIEKLEEKDRYNPAGDRRDQMHLRKSSDAPSIK